VCVCVCVCVRTSEVRERLNVVRRRCAEMSVLSSKESLAARPTADSIRSWAHSLDTLLADKCQYYIDIKKVKGNVLPYSFPSVGPGADPGVQAVSPQVSLSHPSGGRLPLLSSRPAVTSVAFTRWHQPCTVAHIRFIYQPKKDERLSWPGWLTCSGRFTRNSGHPSAASRACDRKSSVTRDHIL